MGQLGEGMTAEQISENKPETGVFEKESFFKIFEKANSIAKGTELKPFLEQMLDLLIQISRAEGAISFLINKQTREWSDHILRGSLGKKILGNLVLNIDEALTWDAINQGSSTLIEASNSQVFSPLMAQNNKTLELKNILVLPIEFSTSPIGAIHLINVADPQVDLLTLIINQMSSQIEKIGIIEEGSHQKARMHSLVDILVRIGSTVDRDQLLAQIVESGRKLLDTESCSIFWSEEPGGDQYLHFASPVNSEKIKNVRVPAQKGIIGAVVSSGKSLLINDVKQDQRFYPEIDKLADFNTRSMVAVPIWEAATNIRQQEEQIRKYVIGGIEAINKKHGEFQKDDVDILELLAAEAATVLQVASLHSNASEMFFDLINALSSAIDAKDPYTKGHSQRVSAISMVIGKSLGLSPKELNHVRTGSLLHDLGKIGVPDHILNKPGKLTISEYEQVKRHTIIGESILSNIRLLENEVPALAQHHERIDGSGYPRGLVGSEISPIGRIVAVADVFDAMMTNRIYREARPVEKVLDYLGKNADLLFDGNMVSALQSEYRKGNIAANVEITRVS